MIKRFRRLFPLIPSIQKFKTFGTTITITLLHVVITSVTLEYLSSFNCETVRSMISIDIFGMKELSRKNSNVKELRVTAPLS